MENKVAVVTGGTGALGRVIVKKLADAGAKVYVPVVSIAEFNKVFDSSQHDEVLKPGSEHSESSGGFRFNKIFGFECNASDESSVVAFIRDTAAVENGKIDFLINTVGGIDAAKNVSDLTSDSLNKMLGINFMSAFYFSREAVKVMENNNFGRIVSIGAIAGLETSPGRFAYSVSKAAVINLMNTISEEMKEKNIRCNTIVPGIMDTPANREWGNHEDIKKWVKPEDIAGIIFDMLSEKYSPLRSSVLKVYGNY